ncbi:unnamed protein product [Peniophora sp. CBMAI 1063]|nr:unnamed protein product [Peniophora sp. CBMAI 1063]
MLVHLAVALFLVGLVIFLFTVNTVLASFVAAATGSTILTYAAPSFIPFLDESCPYRTPLTDALSAVSWFLSRFSRSKEAQQLGLPKWTTSKREIPVKEKEGPLSSERMTFIWARAGSYLLRPEGFGPFSNYMTVVADMRNKAFVRELVKGGFVDRALRQHIESFETMKLADVLGVLRLSSFIVESCGVDERWRTASWNVCIPFAMKRFRALLMSGSSYDELECFDMIIALTRLRKAIAGPIRSRLPQAGEALMAHVESVVQFKTLPVYSEQDPITHLSEANLFSLVAHALTIPVEALHRDGDTMRNLLERELKLDCGESGWRPSSERPLASLELIRVLQKLGLDSWMYPGSSRVISNTQKPYDLLLLGKLSWATGILKNLVQRVRFDEMIPPTFPLPFDSELGYAAMSQVAGPTIASPAAPTPSFPSLPWRLVVYGAENGNSAESGTSSHIPLLVRSDGGTEVTVTERSPGEGRSDGTGKY